MRGRDGGSGFSLIEFVVVLTIMAVVSAVVVPRLMLEPRGGVRGTVRAVVSAYRAARDVAATRGVPATVAVEVSSGRYWVYTEATRGIPADTVRKGVLTLDGGVAIGAGDTRWVVTQFDPFGRARGGRTLVWTRKERYEIAADPWTAAIDVRRR